MLEFREITEDDLHHMGIGNKAKKKVEEEVKAPKGIEKAGLKIMCYHTNKSKIQQREYMQMNIIPRHASSVIFNGKTGSGKTMLLVNLINREEFYGKGKLNKKPYFDKIFLFSPTAGGGDDLVKYLHIEKKYVFVKFDTKMLDKILETQEKIVETVELDKAPKILVILEDIQSDPKFMRSNSFTKLFIQGRHIGISTWLLGQSWTRTPRVCRLQANNIFFFAGSGSEHKLIRDEFCPSKLTNKEFDDMINTATEGQYDFLHINLREPQKNRYRKNLDEVLEITRYAAIEPVK